MPLYEDFMQFGIELKYADNAEQMQQLAAAVEILRARALELGEEPMSFTAPKEDDGVWYAEVGGKSYPISNVKFSVYLEEIIAFEAFRLGVNRETLMRDLGITLPVYPFEVPTVLHDELEYRQRLGRVISSIFTSRQEEVKNLVALMEYLRREHRITLHVGMPEVMATPKPAVIRRRPWDEGLDSSDDESSLAEHADGEQETSAQVIDESRATEVAVMDIERGNKLVARLPRTAEDPDAQDMIDEHFAFMAGLPQVKANIAEAVRLASLIEISRQEIVEIDQRISSLQKQLANKETFLRTLNIALKAKKASIRESADRLPYSNKSGQQKLKEDIEEKSSEARLLEQKIETALRDVGLARDALKLQERNKAKTFDVIESYHLWITRHEEDGMQFNINVSKGYFKERFPVGSLDAAGLIAAIMTACTNYNAVLPAKQIVLRDMRQNAEAIIRMYVRSAKLDLDIATIRQDVHVQDIAKIMGLELSEPLLTRIAFVLSRERAAAAGMRAVERQLSTAEMLQVSARLEKSPREPGSNKSKGSRRGSRAFFGADAAQQSSTDIVRPSSVPFRGLFQWFRRRSSRSASRSTRTTASSTVTSGPSVTSAPSRTNLSPPTSPTSR
jgi:hypothetical protein